MVALLELPDEFFELLAVLLEFPDELAELFDELLLPDDELLLLRADLSERSSELRSVPSLLRLVLRFFSVPCDEEPAELFSFTVVALCSFAPLLSCVVVCPAFVPLPLSAAAELLWLSGAAAEFSPPLPALGVAAAFAVPAASGRVHGPGAGRVFGGGRPHRSQCSGRGGAFAAPACSLFPIPI